MIVAHNQKAADEISSQLNTTCPGLIKRRWRPHTDYTIYTSSEAAEGANDGTESLSGAVSCLKPLKLPHEEAGVLRVQVRPPSPPHLTTRRTELLLGETKPKGTVFQPPLLFAAQEEQQLRIQKLFQEFYDEEGDIQRFPDSDDSGSDHCESKE